MNVLDSVGYNGPRILFMLTILSIWKRSFYLYFYVLFYFMNDLLNPFLKNIIREPRPKGYGDNLETYYKYDDGPHKYGMPSGHSQSVFYSITFLWLVVKSPLLLIMSLSIGSLTLYQRYTNKKHSLLQLLGGAIVGIFVAYITYYISNMKLFVS